MHTAHLSLKNLRAGTLNSSDSRSLAHIMEILSLTFSYRFLGPSCVFSKSIPPLPDHKSPPMLQMIMSTTKTVTAYYDRSISYLILTYHEAFRH